MEYPGREGFTLSLSQQFHCAGWQDDLPCAGVGFGIPSHQPAALFSMKGAVDFQSTATLIEVGPHESADLTSAQTGGQLSVEEVIPEFIGFDRCQENIQLFLG